MLKVVLVSLLTLCQSLKVGYIEFRAGEDASTPHQTIINNTKYVVDICGEAAEKGVDLIVFPEYGITGFRNNWEGYSVVINNYLLHHIPCDVESSAEVLQLASCAAIKFSLYILVNLAEKVDGKLYNTDVVFSPFGELLVRYRKMNLWGEPDFSTPPCNTGTFSITTQNERSLKVGVMTCADLVFGYPQSALIDDDVDFVVLPAAWSNVMPQMQVLAYAQGWSLATNKLIIVCNHNYEMDMTGSGAFQYGKVLSWEYSPGKGNILKTIDISPTRTDAIKSHFSPPATLQHPLSLPSKEEGWVQTALDQTSQRTLSGRICVNGICCKAEAEVKDEIEGTIPYYLMALDGFDTGGGSPKKWRSIVCGVAFCNDGNCKDYFRPNGSSVGIVSLFLQAAGPSLNDASQIVPEVTLTAPFTPDSQISPPAYNFTSGSPSSITFTGSNDLLTSAFVYGRGFNQDTLPYSCSP